MAGNDGLRGLSLEQMKHNISAVVTEAKTRRARVLLVGIQLPPNYGKSYTERFQAIYREVMSASLSLERPIEIAYLGPEATFTHLASLSKFGSSVHYKPCTTISEVFTEVEMRRAEYGVIPIENSTEGAVTHTLDMFVDSELKICSEIIQPISHTVMSTSKSLDDISTIYSNPQVFGQCRSWIEKNVPRAELVDTSSTTAAAVRAQKEDGTAAIGSELAATIYGLNILVLPCLIPYKE